MKKTVLLVDDEISILQSLNRLLCGEGYQIFTATSSAQGIEVLKNNIVQVVISDEQMPTLTGSKFIKKIKKLYPDILCIILSDYINVEDLKEALNEGTIYKFITKPWQDDVLLKHIRSAFAKWAKKEKTEQLVHHDALTGLQNRYAFYESLWNLIAKTKNKGHFAVVYIDIDRFSNLNSVIGPNNSDLILQQLAKRLKTFIKDKKKLARLGNDEFVAVILNTENSSKLLAKLQALFSLIKKSFIINGSKIHLSASVGISAYPQHGEQAELLIKNAHQALQHSKKLGGDNYQLYELSLEETIQSQLFLRDDIYQALGKKQFIIHYQPIFTPDKTKLFGVEALIRWQHPKQGLLLPGKFLNFCEDTNLIVPIGAWILRAACQQVKLWQSLGFPDLTLAINLSVRQINHPLFLDLIADVLETTQFNPRCLILEVTETLLLQDTDKLITLLNALRKQGVALSLDDFGTGYSSLSYLRKFPFTSLKIDQSFINALSTNPTLTAEAIIDTIISLGKTLHLEIIAEGVETEAQLRLLQEKKCNFVQGFLLGKPVPADELKQILQVHKG